MRHDAGVGIMNLLRPVYAGRLTLLILANLCNVVLAVFGNMHHDRDFATYLLAVLMSNLILYTFFYIVMKVTLSNTALKNIYLSIRYNYLYPQSTEYPFRLLPIFYSNTLTNNILFISR